MKLSKVILVRLFFVFFAGFLPAIFLAGCHKDDDGPCLTCPPPAYVSTVQLNMEDVAVTEVWLKLKFTDTINNRSFSLLRNGQMIQTGRLAAQETLLVDYTAQANQSYAYKVLRLNGTVVFDSSDAVPVTTLDATSRFFSSVAIDTLGEYNASDVFDAAIINDTLAYAVGAMTVGDTTYSIAIWNGNDWILRRLTALGPTGVTSYLVPRGIVAFSATDVWFASGGVFHWDGQSTSTTPYWINPFPGNPNPVLSNGQAAEKVWGISALRLYAVGRQGGIAFYNGSSWQQLQSGTTLDIQDIWGVQDAQTGSTTILCAASGFPSSLEGKILRINANNTVDSLLDIPPYRRHSVWFERSARLMVSGDLVFTRYPNFQWQQHQSLPSIYTRHIRGTRMNDVFVVGDFGLVAHYNGLSWKTYPEAAAADVYYSVTFNGKMMIATGFKGGRGIVARMMR